MTDVIDIPNFLNAAAADPAAVAAETSHSPAPSVVTSISNTAARDRQRVVTVSSCSSRLEAVTSIASAAGEGHPAAVCMPLHNWNSERVIDLPAFLRGAPSARDGIEPVFSSDRISNNQKNVERTA